MYSKQHTLDTMRFPAREASQSWIVVSSILHQISSTTSPLKKLEILKANSDNELLLRVIQLTYNPYIKFNVTPETILKYGASLAILVDNPLYDDLHQLLLDLANRKITGNQALLETYAFYNTSSKQIKDIMMGIIDKDLKLRMGVTLINKAIPNLIPVFDVALATDHTKVTIDWNRTWFSSRKLDGVRCIALIDGTGEVHLVSRQGLEFDTLSNIKDAIKTLDLTNTVFDGEICLIDPVTGVEDFQSVMKEIRRKNHNMENAKYLIFDMMPFEVFTGKVDNNLTYQIRYNNLNFIVPAGRHPRLSVVQQDVIKSQAELDTILEDAVSKGWEGLILRANVPYKGARTKDMLKCKTFSDAEYKVERIEIGPIGYVEDGKVTELEVLTNVIIIHKGKEVSVGSGFSHEQRLEFSKYPERIIGKIITVKYFAESLNQKGEYSLRFPTVVTIHGDERTT